MAIKNFVALAATMIALSSCDVAFGPGVYDFSVPLSGDYYLHRQSSHVIFIAPDQWTNGTPIIPEKVTQLDHNDMWIIAQQQQLGDRSPNDPTDNYQEPIPGAFSYWILRTQNPEVWGPLDEQGFAEQRTMLSVPDELQLHNVYDYACGVSKYYKCNKAGKIRE